MIKISNFPDGRSPHPPEILTIGPWVAHRRTLRLEHGQTVRLLEPKVMDLLFALASAPGEVFDRDELTSRLWPNVHVTPDSLTRLVSKLRAALDDDAQQPATIETVSKRGYRLIAAVGQRASGTNPARPKRVQVWLIGALLAAVLVILVLIATRPESPSSEEQRLKRLSEIDQARERDKSRPSNPR